MATIACKDPMRNVGIYDRVLAIAEQHLITASIHGNAPISRRCFRQAYEYKRRRSVGDKVVSSANEYERIAAELGSCLKGGVHEVEQTPSRINPSLLYHHWISAKRT